MDISVGVQEMFVEGPPNVVLRVDADGTEVFVGMSDDDIFIAANFLEDSGLEFGQIGFARMRFEVTKNSSFKIIESFGDIKWRLVWCPLAINSQLLDRFVVLGGIFVIGEKYFEVEITVESLDSFIDVILTDGFLWDRDEFQSKAKNCRCGSRDYFLGCMVMKLLVGEVGKICLRRGFA